MRSESQEMLDRLRDRSKGSVDDVQSRSQDDLLRMTGGEWLVQKP